MGLLATLIYQIIQEKSLLERLLVIILEDYMAILVLEEKIMNFLQVIILFREG